MEPEGSLAANLQNTQKSDVLHDFQEQRQERERKEKRRPKDRASKGREEEGKRIRKEE